MTAWNSLVESGALREGESVLTLGTGGVSIFAVQFAKLLGGRVIATSSSDEKIEKLKALGADETINYVREPEWADVVRSFTNGDGVDHVVEVGGAGTIERSLAAARIAGHIALIGALTGGASIDAVTVFMKALRVQGIFVGSREMFERMLAKIGLTGFRPVIDRTFEFRDTHAAIEYMKSGEHFGKVVVEF
jgi:NADPH:quinone reductase-like Zn-dependent oxidoreductase